MSRKSYPIYRFGPNVKIFTLVQTSFFHTPMMIKMYAVCLLKTAKNASCCVFLMLLFFGVLWSRHFTLFENPNHISLTSFSENLCSQQDFIKNGNKKFHLTLKKKFWFPKFLLFWYVFECSFIFSKNSQTFSLPSIFSTVWMVDCLKEQL